MKGFCRRLHLDLQRSLRHSSLNLHHDQSSYLMYPTCRLQQQDNRALHPILLEKNRCGRHYLQYIQPQLVCPNRLRFVLLFLLRRHCNSYSCFLAREKLALLRRYQKLPCLQVRLLWRRKCVQQQPMPYTPQAAHYLSLRR
jgi:hypothetical protein